MPMSRKRRREEEEGREGNAPLDDGEPMRGPTGKRTKSGRTSNEPTTEAARSAHKRPRLPGRVRKLAVQHSNQGPNEIYLSKKTDLAAYLKRGRKMVLEQGYHQILIHALSAAIPQAIVLAFALRDSLGLEPEDVAVETRTKSVASLDEVIPEDVDEDIQTQTRLQSAVTITFRVLARPRAAQILRQSASVPKGPST